MMLQLICQLLEAQKTGRKSKSGKYYKIERFDKYTLLEVKIDTGRTHQIRVHLSQIGYPVVGDEVYSNGKNEFGVHGQLLHAKSLDFTHPSTGEKIHLEAEIPTEFANVLKKLRGE